MGRTGTSSVDIDGNFTHVNELAMHLLQESSLFLPRLYRVSVVVSFIGLGLEFVEEGGDGVILALDKGSAVLPNTVFRPPLAVGWIALILMNVVHAKVFGEGFTEDIQPF